MTKSAQTPGVGDAQSTFLRKTSFKLIIFSNIEVSATRISSLTKLTSCWTDHQRKADRKRLKFEEKREKRMEKQAAKLKEKQGGE